MRMNVLFGVISANFAKRNFANSQSISADIPMVIDAATRVNPKKDLQGRVLCYISVLRPSGLRRRGRCGGESDPFAAG
jgi:hypothetical protein